MELRVTRAVAMTQAGTFLGGINERNRRWRAAMREQGIGDPAPMPPFFSMRTALEYRDGIVDSLIVAPNTSILKGGLEVYFTKKGA